MPMPSVEDNKQRARMGKTLFIMRVIKALLTVTTKLSKFTY